jgi:uncharacterized protein (UPF0335 family)
VFDLRLKISQTFDCKAFNKIIKLKHMSKKIPKETLIDLHECSINDIMNKKINEH